MKILIWKFGCAVASVISWIDVGQDPFKRVGVERELFMKHFIQEYVTMHATFSQQIIVGFIALHVVNVIINVIDTLGWIIDVDGFRIITSVIELLNELILVLLANY